MARRAKQKTPNKTHMTAKKLQKGSVGKKHLVKADLFLKTSEIVFGLEKEHLG